jgi:Ca-activated chloride channel homolog
LYRRIGAPVMTDVELTVDVEDAAESDGPTVDRLFPAEEFDLFAGDQAVIVGRYRTPGDAKVKLTGPVNGEKDEFDFPAEFVEESDDDTNAFVAKLWATRRVGEIIDELDLKGRNEELVKELVDLATEHGILTPYTSFLADENSSPQEVAEVRRHAELRLGQLDDVAGDAAFRQREAKAAYRYAARPASAGAGGYGAALAAEPTDQFFAGEALGSIAESGGRGVWYYDAERDEQTVAANFIAVGRKTFFRRGEQWVDASVTEDEMKSSQKIERFSREYFDLVKRHGKHVAQYLAIDGPVCVKLDDVVYSW